MSIWKVCAKCQDEFKASYSNSSWCEQCRYESESYLARIREQQAEASSEYD